MGNTIIDNRSVCTYNTIYMSIVMPHLKKIYYVLVGFASVSVLVSLLACTGPTGPTAEEIQKLKGEFQEWRSRWAGTYGPSPHTITGGISSSRMINLPLCGTVIGSGGIAYKGFDMDPSVRLGTQEIALSGGHTVLGTPVYSSGFTLEIRPPALSGEESWTGKYFNQLRLLLDSCMIESASETPPAAKPAAGKPEAVTQTPETNLELPEVTTGLVGHWKFDEDTGEVAKDSSDYGHDGSLVGIPTRAEGKFGGALSFDGVKDYVKISDASELRLPTAQTISTWYKWAGSGADWRRLVGKGGYGKRNYGLWVNSDTGEALFQIWGLPARPGGCEAKSKVAFDTAWHHLAGTYDGARIQLYYDGILVDAKGCTTTPHTSSDSVTIGFANADGVPMHSPFHGFVDEVRIYNRTLSDCEIAALAADPC